jgi:hypothetical protein
MAMSTVQVPVSDMLVTVKSREVQRGMLAEMSKRNREAAQHFLAAAHLELVLADDYQQADDLEQARRSRISAASCFWGAGERERATAIFDALAQEDPEREDEIHEIMGELER